MTRDFGDRVFMSSHGLKRRVLRAHSECKEESAVLAGDEARGHRSKQPYGSAEQGKGNEQRDKAVPQNQQERTIVGACHGVEPGFETFMYASVPRGVVHPEQAATQHGRKGQRDKPEIRIASAMVTENSC